MPTPKRTSTPASLRLPHEFEDLTGLLEADLQAIVAMITNRADERLYLTRREREALRSKLSARLRKVIEESVEPLQIQYR